MRTLSAQWTDAIANAAIALVAVASLAPGSSVSGAARLDGRPLCEAASAGDLARVRELIAKGDALEEDDEITPLMCAARNDHGDVLDVLLKAGANADHRTKHNESALAFAACFDRTAIAKKLFDSGASIGGELDGSGTDFHMAAAHDDTELVALFLAHATSIDLVAPKIGARTPLHVAAEHGCVHVVKQLLDAGASPAARTDRGWTPLHLAAICGREHVVALLLDPTYAVDIDAADSVGATALHWAAGFGSMPVVEALLSPGEHAKPNALARDRHGWIALDYAAASGRRDCAKRLADEKSIQSVTDLRRSAAHIAGMYGHEELLADLVAAKADALAHDAHGKTAADLLDEFRGARAAHESTAADSTPKGSPLAAKVTTLDCRIRFLEYWRACYGVERASGVTICVWSDGAVLFRDTRKRGSTSMRVTTLEPWRVERFVTELAETNLFVMAELPTIPDACRVELTLQEHRLPVKRTWDRELKPPADGSVEPLAEHLTAARAWDLTLAVADSLFPTESWTFAAASRNGDFRGYDANGEPTLH